MLEKFISAILVPYLSKYAENFDSKQLNVDLWSGKATLKDLVLKSSVLDALLQSDTGSSGAHATNTPTTATATNTTNTTTTTTSSSGSGSPPHRRLPVTLQRGICREVNISIPFRQLRSKPVVVEVGELFICLRGDVESAGAALDKGARLDAAAARKARDLEQFEAERQRQKEMAAAAAAAAVGGQTESAAGGGCEGNASQEGGGESKKAKSGYFTRLGELIVNNIVFKAHSIHIRYEDEATQTVMGVILGGVHLLTIDNNTGEATFVDPTGLKRTHKRLEFSGMQVYCDDPVRHQMHPNGYFFSQLSDVASWILAMRNRVNEGDVDLSTVFGPVKGHVNASLVFKQFLQELPLEPYLAVRMKLDSVMARVNRSQYLSLVRTASLFTNRTELNEFLARRPSVSVKGHARVWWRYAINAVRAVAGSPRRERLLQRISEVCMMDYQIIYRDVVRKAEMSPEKQRAYRFITRFMTVPDMIAGRKYVYTQLANEIQLKRKDIESKKIEAQSDKAKKNTGWFGWFRRNSSTPQDILQEEAAFEELERSYGLDPNNPDETSTELLDVAHLPASYCWFDVQFEMDSLLVSAVLSDTERFTLMLHQLRAQFFRFNAQDSIQFDLITRNLTLSNPVDSVLLLTRLPIGVEDLRKEETYGDVPLLSCNVAINPVEQPLHDTHLDFVMDARLLPLRIVTDPSTIDCLVRFFEFPKGSNMAALVNRTKEIAASVGSRASAEVRLAMGRLKSMKVNVDVAAPHIILPKNLRTSPDEPALTVSLGHVRFDTQPLTETEKQSRLAASYTDTVNEDVLYYSSTATFADFYVGLAPVGEALERRDAGFMLLPEVAFSAAVLQRIDSYADNRERFIIRMEVPTLRVACSVSQAFILSSLVEQWLRYLYAPRKNSGEVTSPYRAPFDKAFISSDVSGGRNANMAVVSGSVSDSTFPLSRTRRADSESEERNPMPAHVSSRNVKEDLPFVRLHLAVREMGVVIYEDDTVTRQPLSTPRFTLAFRTSTFTLHVRTVQKRMEVLLDQPYCQDARDPEHLILSGSSVCCNVLTAPDKPIDVDIQVEPSLHFRLGTPCIQLLEALMDIFNLISTAPDAAAAAAATASEETDEQFALRHQSQRGGSSGVWSSGAGAGTEADIQAQQLRQVEQLSAMPDLQVARLNLRIGGTSTVELMNYRPGVDAADYPFAYVSFTEVVLDIKKNGVTFELNGGVDQVTVTLSDAHQVAPANRVILEYRAPLHSVESSAKKFPLSFSTTDGEKDYSGLDKSRVPSHRCVSFTYRTSRPVMPIFVADSKGKRHLTNASELRFSSFVEMEIGSSAVLLDMHSIMTLLEYFSTGFFSGVTQLASRPRYNGEVINLSTRPVPPPLLTSVRIFARDLAFVLPIDARTDGGRFQVSVDHVAVQSSLLCTDGQQAMTISLREIQMMRSGPSETEKDTNADGSQEVVLRTPTSRDMTNVLMPTTSLDVSVKSPLDPLAEDPLRVDLKGDDLSLAITERDLVELCQLVSGNLTRFPTTGTSHTTASSAFANKSETATAAAGTESALEEDVSLAKLQSPELTSGKSNVARVREVHVTWRAGNVAVSFLDNLVQSQRFRLIGSAFTLQMVKPNNLLVLCWDSLELFDVQEEANQHATMFLCGASRVEMRNVLTTRGTLQKSFDVRSTTLNSIETAVEPTEGEPSSVDPAPPAAKTDALEVTTLIIDFTLHRFAISDQWLAVYDFVCNESVMRALQPVMAPSSADNTDAISSAGAKDTTPQKSFRCLVTTRAVSIPFLTSTRETFLEADVNSLFIDVMQIANTTNVAVRMRDLTVRHCDSGERIVFKRSEQILSPINDDLCNSADIAAAFPAANSAPVTSSSSTAAAAAAAAVVASGGPNTASAAVPTAAASAAPAAAAVATAAGGKSGDGTEEDIFTMHCALDAGSERQKVTIALGRMSALCALPLLMRLVEYCTAPDQPIAKISNLGVMRERREWLARAAGDMVDKRAFSLHLVWQQPCIIFAGDALDLTNKSRNIEAQLGVMRATVHMDKRQDSCVAVAKINDFAIPDMLEKSGLRFSYNMKDRRESISVVLEKTTALLHPAELEKLFWVLQRNILMPRNATTQAENTAASVETADEQEQQKQQEQQQDSSSPVREATPVISRTAQFETAGLVLALHDVVGINFHTATLNGLDVKMDPSGDVKLTLSSFSVVEHYTSKQLMHSTSASDTHCMTILHSASDNTIDVQLMDVNFVLLPRPLGTLFNVAMSLQFPPPLEYQGGSPRQTSSTRPLEEMAGQKPQKHQQQQQQQDLVKIPTEGAVVPVTSETGGALVRSVRVSLKKCRTTTLFRDHEICAIDVVGATMEYCTFNNATNILKAVVPWVVVHDLISPNTRHPEIVHPLAGCDASTNVVEFSFETLLLQRAMSISADEETDVPTFTHRLQCRINSLAFVLIPEVAFAVMRALSDVKEHISDVNREKAYDYVADKATHRVQERQKLVQVEVVLNRPSILLVDTPTTNRAVEVLPGNLIVRNELTNSHTEVFSFSLDSVALHVLGASAFRLGHAIQMKLSRSFSKDTAAEQDLTTVTVNIPRFFADVSQDQLSCLFDVMGAFRHAGTVSMTTDSLARPTSPNSQLGTLEAASAGSGAAANTPSIQTAPMSTMRKRQPTTPLQSGHTAAGTSPVGDGKSQVVTPPATTAPARTASRLFVTAAMEGMEVNIDGYFSFGVDGLKVVYATAPTEMETTISVDLETILLQHRVTGDRGGSTIFAVQHGVFVSKSTTTSSLNVRNVEVNMDINVDTVQVALSPLMLVDTRELLYGPFCMKVLRVPLQPIPVCHLLNEVMTLDGDLVLDSNHVLVTANKTRCVYRLDLNQHRLFFSGAPSAQLVIDDGCHLTITNGTIIIPGTYSLDSFASFGLNAALFTSMSCVVEKQLHCRRSIPAGSAQRVPRQRQKSCMDSSISSPTMKSSSNVNQVSSQPSQRGFSSPPAPPPQSSVPAIEERVQTIASLQCADVRFRLMDDVVEELGVTLLMTTGGFYSQETEGGLITRRGGSLRLGNVRTGERDETTLLPTGLEVSMTGVDEISISINAKALEMSLRVALMRSIVELGKDFWTAFMNDSTIQRHAPRVSLEDEHLRPLLYVNTPGECRSCCSSHALVGESADAPGVLCYRCCTGRDVRSRTEARFELSHVNIVLIGDGGGMLRLSSPNVLTMHLSLNKHLNANFCLFVHNLNPGAAVWEPLVERFVASAGGEVLESSFWVNVERFDYVISPGNVKVLLQIVNDFSATSIFQRRLSSRGSPKSIALNDEMSSQEAAAKQPVGTTTGAGPIRSLKGQDSEVPYAFVHVQNNLNDTLVVDDKEVLPRGGTLEFETMKTTLVACRGFLTNASNAVKIDLSKSSLYLRSYDILFNIHLELLHTEGCHHLQRIVRLSCYPVHNTDSIICFENNLSHFLKIWHGVPFLKPGERFYFQPSFSLDEKLQICPVRTPEGEEYAAAMIASSGIVPTMRDLLNSSFTKLICVDTKNPRRRLIIKMVEHQEGVQGGIPTFVLAIQPELLLENYLPCSIFITLFLKSKSEKRSGHDEKDPLYTGVVDSQKTADVFLRYAILEDVVAHIEVRQGDDAILYHTKKDVPISKRNSTIILHGTCEGTPEFRLNVQHVEHRVIFSSSYAICNFTPLPLRIQECKSSGELVSKALTNFEILPKNMQRPYAAASRSSDSEFFVNVSCGNHKASTVPFHVQARGLILLKVKKSSSTSSLKRHTSNSSVNREGDVFNLMYLTQMDKFGTLVITIVPRWILVNRTPRPLFVVPATPGMSAKDFSSPTTSTTVAESSWQSMQQFFPRTDLAQYVPANSATSFFATSKCAEEVEHHAFVLQSLDASVRGSPINLEEIANAMVIAAASGTEVDSDVIIETSVVVDGAYTFCTLQDPLVPPNLLFNRTGEFLEIFDMEDRLLSRAFPGSIFPLLVDRHVSNRRTRVRIAKNPSVAESEVSSSAANAEVRKLDTSYVEFDFFRLMTPEEEENPLEIKYKGSFGAFGQRIIELLPRTECLEVTHAYRRAPPGTFKCVFNMSLFTVSAVRENSDILFAAVKDTRAQYNREGNTEVLTFSIKNVQVDNQTEMKPIFEVCLIALRPTEEAHCISGYIERTIVPAKALLYVNEVRLDVMPLVIRISDKILIAVLAFIRQLFKEEPLREVAPTNLELFDMAPLQVGAMNTRIIMERMVVNPLIVRLWFEREDGDFIREEMRIPTAALVSMMVRSCEDVRIETPGMAIQSRTAMAGVMIQWVMQVYLNDLKSQIRGLIFQYASSLPLLGAPIKLVSGVGIGAMKFFREPIAGLSSSPKAFALGLASGSTGFAAEVVGGGFGAVSNLAKTGANFMSVGVTDRERRKTNVFRGIASGVKGVVTKPMEGAAESGAAGLFKGVGIGLLGVVTNPVAGLLSDVSKVTSTVAQICDDSYLPKLKRMRKLRDFHSNGAVAEYHSLISIYQYERGEFRGSNWVKDMFIPTDGPVWYPYSKDEAQKERGVPLSSWRLDRFDTNFEGWTFSNKYHGVYTRAQTSSARTRRRRWAAQLKQPEENRLALLVQVQGGSPEPGREEAQVASASASASAPAPASAAAAPSPAREEVLTVDLFEHESKVALIGWSSRFLPSEFKAWETPKGGAALRKSDVRPPSGWVWSSAWTTVGGDADGWSYIRRDNKEGASTLRRRHWRRSMKRVK